MRDMTILRDRVAELRPLYLQPAGTGRTVYEARELAQRDLWEPPVDSRSGLPSPHVCRWGLAWDHAQMILSKHTYDMRGGHRWCLE